MTAPLPNDKLKKRLETLIPELRRRALRPVPRRRDYLFFAVLLGLGLTAGFCVSLGRHSQGVVDGFLHREIRDFNFDVFLTEHVDRSFLEERFLSTPGVRSVRFVTREEALGRAQDDPALVDALKLTVRNPLPESFEVVWDPAFLVPSFMGTTAKKWGDLDGVLQVGYDRSRLERMALLGRVRNEWRVFFAALLWGGAVALVLGLGRFLFSGTSPLRFASPLGGIVAGALGGSGGVLIVFLWLGTANLLGGGAGILVGLLGGLLRGRENE